jgi:hypothetical protein
MAMVELFSTTLRIGTLQRTAVSQSRPVMPNAASPMKLTRRAASMIGVVGKQNSCEMFSLFRISAQWPASPAWRAP